VPEWRQKVCVHNVKLDVRGVMGRRVRDDRDSPHAHRIDWPEKHSTSMERDVKVTTDMPPAYTSTTSPATTTQTQPTATATTEDGGHKSPEQASAPDSGAGVPPERVTPDDRLEESTWVIKPTGYAQRLAKGEGSADEKGRIPGGMPDLKKTDPDRQDRKERSTDAEQAFTVEPGDTAAAAIGDAQGDPRTIHKARSRPDWHSWEAAMDREVDALRQAKTWKTVARPTDKNAVRRRKVFRIRRKADRSTDKHKTLPSWRIAHHALNLGLRDGTATLAGEWCISAISVGRTLQDWEQGWGVEPD
jgi:hypothetical protein